MKRNKPATTLKAGQLVACRDAASGKWRLMIFDSVQDGRLFAREPEWGESRRESFAQVVPAERIWPGIFLASDKEARAEAEESLTAAYFAGYYDGHDGKRVKPAKKAGGA